MKAAPSGSGRNSYVSSNYSNFLSQNSRRKLPRARVCHLAEKGIARGLPPTPRRFATESDNPSPPPSATLHDPPSSAQKRLFVFPEFERGGREKPTRKFQARFSHSRNSTLHDAFEGLALCTGMRVNFAKSLPLQMDKNRTNVN